jgi:hypothetical protein
VAVALVAFVALGRHHAHAPKSAPAAGRDRPSAIASAKPVGLYAASVVTVGGSPQPPTATHSGSRSPDLLLAREAAATGFAWFRGGPTVRFAVVVGEAPQLKPLLLLDVDGVLNPFPETPDGYGEYDLFTADDEPVRLSPRHGKWLRELASPFEIVWASAWGETANELICPIFGLSAFPVIAFPPVPFEPREKVPAVATFTADRAAAWVDDIITDEARAWAARRDPPTLLIEVCSVTGLTRDAVERLFMWHTVVAPSD